MKTATNIIKQIQDPKVNMTLDDIRSAQRALKHRFKAECKDATSDLAVNDRVVFERRGEIRHGIVEKVNRKTALVRVTKPRMAKGNSIKIGSALLQKAG